MITPHIEATTVSLEAFYNKSKRKFSKKEKEELEQIIQQYKNCPSGITPADVIQLAAIIIKFMMMTAGNHH